MRSEIYSCGITLSTSTICSTGTSIFGSPVLGNALLEMSMITSRASFTTCGTDTPTVLYPLRSGMRSSGMSLISSRILFTTGQTGRSTTSSRRTKAFSLSSRRLLRDTQDDVVRCQAPHPSSPARFRTPCKYSLWSS